jgi:type II secretion system protein G
MNTRGKESMKWGFTLIELLIVVAIIAILAAIAVPNFLEAQTRAKVSRAKADIKAMVTGLEAYVVDNNHYVLGAAYTDTAFNALMRYACPLVKLTTPIAYLSRLPGDAPFGTTVLADPRNTVVFKGYYYNGPDQWESYVNAGYCDNGLFPYSYRYNRYTIYCTGPTKVMSGWSGGGYSTYDPTNGTVSWGDI